MPSGIGTLAGLLASGLVTACMVTTPGNRAPVMTDGSIQTSPSPTASDEGAASPFPASGSDTDWDQMLNAAFGPKDPAFSSGGPSPQPTPQPADSSNPIQP